MKTLRLGPVSFLIPASFSTEDAKDSLIVRSREGSELQVSAIRVMKAGVAVPGAAKKYVEDRGQKEGREVVISDSRSWFKQPDDAGEGLVGSLWYAGINTHLVIITSTIKAGLPDTEAAVDRVVDELIHSLEIEHEEA
jgi:hypothetical protein